MLIGSSIQSIAVLNRSNAITGNRNTAPAASASSISKTEETNEDTKTSTSRSTTQELLKKLNEYIEKGPVAAMREKILESMGLTEEELKTLPPEKQKAIEAEIGEKIKEMLLRQQEAAKSQQATAGKAGLYTALSGL